jgi:hypothetical protein
MASEKCRHSSRVNGVVKLDFARQSTPDGPMYSGGVSVAVCEECGHVELHATLHHLLCDWLRGPEGGRGYTTPATK